MINHKYMNNKGFTFIELVIAIFILAILFSMAQPNVRRSSPRSRQKACYSNIRVLTGATEMYNMDVKEENLMKSLDIEPLINNKYLKEKPIPTEVSCRYLSTYNDKDGLYIWCDYHGDIQGHITGKYDE